MKKIIIVLAVLSCVQFANAQVKSAADLKKAVESAEAVVENPKKADNVAAWVKIGDAYMNAYTNVLGQGWRGASQQELMLVLGNDKPTSSEYVTVGGANYTKDVFATRNYYYDENGILSIIEVTQPVYEDALDRALNAYQTAYEKDAKGSKTKDISAGIGNVDAKYLDEGITQYMLGNLDAASVCFEKAAAASECAPYSSIDSLAVYNAGFTAVAAGNYERAKGFFEKAIEIGYYEDGESYAKLGDCLSNLEQTDQSKTVLEEGFAKFPQNQAILIGLINYYVTTGQDPDQLFKLLDQAKENEPNNASLYYVEGDIHKQLGEKDAAIAAYAKASEINPEYEFGYIGIGILYYNEAIDIQDQASNEMDDAKYNQLVEDFEQALINAIDPFEKAFEVTKSDEIKVNLAEYLRNIYYRFRDRDAKYNAGYEKYNNILTNGL
ncbi:MAG: hypothetical protein LUC24_03715 [Bacteroidales bacterium]|nr:hypothetical protein [Bacteroidales bacterium]